MLLKLFLALPIIFSTPELTVNWLTSNQRSVALVLQGEDPIIGKCLQSSLTLRYKYQLQICKRRPLWFDVCKDELELRRSVTFDPISRTYDLNSKWAYKAEEEIVQHFSSRMELLKSLQTIKAVDLNVLAENSLSFIQSQRSYISARVSSDCKGDYNETLAELSHFLSFGLIRISGFDTGWLDFRMRERSQSK